MTAVDILLREVAGEFPRGFFLAHAGLERITDPAERRPIVERLVRRYPEFAPGWLEWGKLCKDCAERRDAFDRGMAARPDPETKGMLLLNKALGLSTDDRSAAAVLLRNLIDDPASTTATEALARHCLGQLESGRDLFS